MSIAMPKPINAEPAREMCATEESGKKQGICMVLLVKGTFRSFFPSLTLIFIVKKRKIATQKRVKQQQKS